MLKGGDNINLKSSDDYCEIYEELADILNDTAEVEKIYRRYRGLTITFPKKLYSKKYVDQYIKEKYGKESIHIIAQHLDLSERRIRQIVKEFKGRE